MNATTLKKRVQELGELRFRMGELKAAERQLSDDVRDAMTGGTGLKPAGHGTSRTRARVATVQSRDYIATLAEQRRLVLDPKRFRTFVQKKDKKAGEKVFLECARIDLKAARRHFPNGDLDKLGEIATSMQLRISGLRKATPRQAGRAKK